jgi:predicted transcriptional regulator
VSKTKTENTARALVEEVFKTAERIAREELESEYTVRCEIIRAEVTSENEVNAKAVFYYITKLMEISWSVGEGFKEYIEGLEQRLGRELTEDEVEEKWLERYNEALEEINAMYAIDARGEIYTEIFRSGVLHIRFEPLLCREDYCEVGLVIEVELLELPLEVLRANPEYVADTVARAVVYVVNLATL